MAYIKMGRDTNGNKTAKLVTDAGSFTKQVNVTAEMGSAFYGFYKGDKIIIGDLYGMKAAQTFLNHYKEFGTEREKRIVAAAGC